MRRVLVVITTAFVKWGGLTNAYMNYYRAMDKTGLIIDVASMNNPEADLISEINENGGTYIQLPDKRKKPLSYVVALYKCCKGYNVIHVHGNSATMSVEMFIAKVAGISNRIAHCHTNKCMHPFLNAIGSPLLKIFCTCKVAVSEDAGAWLYGNNNFITLNNAIDSELYRYNEVSRNSIRKKYCIEESKIVIGHVGKIYDAKNHDFLVDVFQRLDEKYDVVLMLVGDGVLKNEIYKKVVDLGLKDSVVFTGMQDDTEEFYSAMDIFMFPSLYEGFGLALLEAQSSGLECIASTAVPRLCNITGKVHYKDLKLDDWINAFSEIIEKKEEQRVKTSNSSIVEIKKAGFDNKLNANRMRELYLQ